MYEIEGLNVKRDKGKWIVSDDTRNFKIDAKTLEVDQDWFCSYEVIVRILSVLSADKQLEE